MHGEIFKTQLKLHSLDYIWERKKVKNINLRIKNNGEVVVSSNTLVSKEEIEAFVESKYDWIIKKQKQVNDVKKISYLSKEHLMLFGRKLTIKLAQGKQDTFRYTKNYFYITLVDLNTFEAKIQQYLDQLAYEIFKDVMQVVSMKMKGYYDQFPILTIKVLKGKWGSCAPSKNEIVLNRDLIHCPVDFCEYVVLHEFVHFIHPNHSKAFYDLVETLMPDYKRRVQMLDDFRLKCGD